MLAWALTDGSADDETRCLGVAEAVADRVERRRVAPRAPWSWMSPYGPVDPRDFVGGAPAGPISPDRGWPDLVVSAGRKAVPYLACLKRASNGRVVTAYLGDTRAGRLVADIVAVGPGARLRGPNVVASETRPHRVGTVRLAAAHAAPPLFPRGVGGPRVGVMLGGARRRRWSQDDFDRLAAGLARLRDDGAAIVATARVGADDRLDLAARKSAHYVWSRQGADPAVRMLAQSDALVVAVDDLLALDEAVATGVPVLAFRPSRLDRKAAAAVDRLVSLGVVRPFAGRLEPYTYAPLDSTPEIARAISAVIATRAALRPRPERRAIARSRETNGPTAR